MKIHRALTVTLATLAGVSLINTGCLAATKQLNTQAETQFVNTMVTQDHFNRARLSHILAHAKYLPNVIAKMNRPFESKPWDFYQRHFITPERIAMGEAYWKKHATVLSAVQKIYGVPAQVIVAIIGVETLYGTRTGTYSALSSLSTLAFNYPKRARFFSKELQQYILLTQQQHLNPLTLEGSYAGALGIPQFMPSSYRHYGVDYSKNQQIDLFTNNNDAIASVANFLQKGGWQRGQAVAFRAKLTNAKAKTLATKTARPKLTVAELAQHGVQPIVHLKPTQKAALIALQGEQQMQYWVTLRNFRAIMNYNPSTNYSMAVYQLSQALLAHHRTA